MSVAAAMAAFRGLASYAFPASTKSQAFLETELIQSEMNDVRSSSMHED